MNCLAHLLIKLHQRGIIERLLKLAKPVNDIFVIESIALATDNSRNVIVVARSCRDHFVDNQIFW